ncbi:hypothetical protein [Paracoccus mutanolyticus]|uniref:hypothetical protein n=1 Tax=Paracoccus mutanolyticus TaxID=1499308 RepID=UPI001CB8A1E0|nr:hypothetical protein [Paracoccus mutanolyticus]
MVDARGQGGGVMPRRPLAGDGIGQRHQHDRERQRDPRQGPDRLPQDRARCP